eukprot:TRINITY_DN16841_c2_g3_i1.p1 TRINITY_DN16841_c2_g3~~TRINITY_DN16841_c2_g3_i1.p1  ORF type:complete len:1749 (-),score=408.88 TRINITY_DN16841_c2_g3_i1:138-4730(-)
MGATSSGGLGASLRGPTSASASAAAGAGGGGDAEGGEEKPAAAEDVARQRERGCVASLCPHATERLTAETCSPQKMSGWLRFVVVAGVSDELEEKRKEEHRAAVAATAAAAADAAKLVESRSSTPGEDFEVRRSMKRWAKLRSRCCSATNFEGAFEAEKAAREAERAAEDAKSPSSRVKVWKKSRTARTEVALLSPQLLAEVLDGAGAAAEAFWSNRDALASRWLGLLRNFAFPGVPPDVAWALAEVGERHQVAAGAAVVGEGEVVGHDDGSAKLVRSGDVAVIEEGEAIVEKLVFTGKGRVAQPLPIGRLSAGASIGDLCLLSGRVSPAATVRARSALTLLHFKSEGLMKVLERYPGLVACAKRRLREIATNIQPNLVPRPAALRLLPLFSDCGEEFFRELVFIAERRRLNCGDVVQREGDGSCGMNMVEFGMVRVERKGHPVETATIGRAFGQRLLIGLDKAVEETVRVATPMAMLLTIPREFFTDVLERYPLQRKRFQATGARLASKSCGVHSRIRELSIFHGCGRGFLDALEGMAEVRCAMPGDTMTVQGAIDQGSMFVINGGRTVVETDGKVVVELGVGAAFGERAMLGVVRCRTSTVRAVTPVMLTEIPRATFLAVLDQHPEENERFAELMTRVGVEVGCIQWPIFKGGSIHLFYLVNLHTERRITRAGSWTSRKGDALETNAAVLVMQGKIELYDDSGALLDTITDGDCFNEQVLLGYPPIKYNPVPETMCEVQILRKTVFDQIMSEVESARRDVTKELIITEMARHAQRRLGFGRCVWQVLQLSALFRGAPVSFLQAVHKHLEPRYYEEGSVICQEGEEGTQMFFLLSGGACIASDLGRLDLPTGSSFGEANALGIVDHYSTTVRATCLSSSLTLARDKLLGAMNEDYDAMRWLDRLLDAGARGRRLDLARSSFLVRAGAEFASVACRDLDDVVYAPSETIIAGGQACALGETPVFILISGGAVAEGEHGTKIGKLEPGDVIGEGGGLGLSMERSATVRAYDQGLVHCVRLHGFSVKAAVDACPQQYGALVSMFDQRRTAKAELQQQRRTWLEEVVTPMLRALAIFAEVPKEILVSAIMFCEATSHAPGELITRADAEVEGMMLLLDGEAMLESPNGDVVGRISRGASIDELAALSLVSTCHATVRAATACVVFAVPTRTLQEACALHYPSKASGDGETLELVARSALERMRKERRRQVVEGLPLCSLPLDLSAQDITVRGVALRADRLLLQPGDAWTLLPNTSPGGSHFGIVVRGRASLMIGEERVMTLLPGALVLEDLAADYEAFVQANTVVEAYRVRLSDFVLSTHRDPTARSWAGAFKHLGSQEWERTRARLENARGVTNCRVAPPSAIVGSLPWHLQSKIGFSATTSQETTPAMTPPQLWSPTAAAAAAPAARSPLPLTQERQARTQLELLRESPLLQQPQRRRLHHAAGNGKRRSGAAGLWSCFGKAKAASADLRVTLPPLGGLRRCQTVPAGLLASARDLASTGDAASRQEACQDARIRLLAMGPGPRSRVLCPG